MMICTHRHKHVHFQCYFLSNEHFPIALLTQHMVANRLYTNMCTAVFNSRALQ